MIRYADDWPETRCVVCCVEGDDPPTGRLSYYKLLDYRLRTYPAHIECAEWAMDARRHIAKLNGSAKDAGIAKLRPAADEDGVEESYNGRFGLLLGGLR